MNAPRNIISLIMLVTLPSCLLATNGDNLIAIGPVARGMGGLSVSYPQDPISAVFANPAAMCFGPYCPMSEVNASVTAFMPAPSAKVTNPFTGDTIAADSDDPIYFIPAIGLSHPLPFGEQNRWRFGMSAYGVSGLGVDYRGSALDATFGDLSPGPLPASFAGAPLATGLYTQLQIMKVAPALAYQILPNLSFGASVHFNYSELEIDDAEADGTTFGYQLGLLYTPHKNVFIGLSYTSPQEINYKDVIVPAPGSSADLALESPQQVAVGISLELMDKRLLLGIEGRWINWGDANGYEDFEWDDQYVISLGAQYKLIQDKLTIRAGYNYGNNPVSENDGWDGSFDFDTEMPNDVVNVQGTIFPRYYYESFRIVGFPAIVEHHATVGFTYNFNERLALNFAYMHAFEETITESGTNPLGGPTEIESSLYEDSIEIGVSWRF